MACDYLDFIRSKPCLICGRRATAHHQPQKGGGIMAGKVEDDRAVPLCMEHHCGNGTVAQPGGYDNLSWTLWERYSIDIEQVILELNEEYFFGIIV